MPLCPKAPASSEYERDPGPCAIEGTRRGVRCKAGRPPRPPALTLARSPHGPGVQDRTDNPKAPGLLTVECVTMTQADDKAFSGRWPRSECEHACRSQRPLCPVPLFSVAVADITKNQPHSLWRASALQVAACGLCSPATGGTGAAASCGVARAASRDDRERPTVPLGTAQSRRTVRSGYRTGTLPAVVAI